MQMQYSCNAYATGEMIHSGAFQQAPKIVHNPPNQVTSLV
jgi:hypothetical protein